MTPKLPNNSTIKKPGVEIKSPSTAEQNRSQHYAINQMKHISIAENQAFRAQTSQSCEDKKKLTLQTPVAPPPNMSQEEFNF